MMIEVSFKRFKEIFLDEKYKEVNSGFQYPVYTTIEDDSGIVVGKSIKNNFITIYLANQDLCNSEDLIQYLLKKVRTLEEDLSILKVSANANTNEFKNQIVDLKIGLAEVGIDNSIIGRIKRNYKKWVIKKNMNKEIF